MLGVRHALELGGGGHWDGDLVPIRCGIAQDTQMYFASFVKTGSSNKRVVIAAASCKGIRSDWSWFRALSATCWKSCARISGVVDGFLMRRVK